MVSLNNKNDKIIKKKKITNYLLNNYIGVKSSNCHKPFIIKGINNNNNLKHYFKEQQKNVKK